MGTNAKYEAYFCQRCGKRFVDTAMLSTLQINPRPILCWSCRKSAIIY